MEQIKSVKIDEDKGCNGNASSYYKTMGLKELCNMPISEITNENCILFMWGI